MSNVKIVDIYGIRVETKFNVVGFEVFTAVVLKSIFFWDMTPCSALSGTQCSASALHGVISQKKILFKI
jgi:hypothetical protein